MREDLIDRALAARQSGSTKRDAFLDPLEDRIVAALERQPEIAIDSGFAARVAASVPRRRNLRVLAPVTGRRVALAALAMLLVGLTLIAPSSHSRVALGLEWCLLAEFLGIAVWLGMTSAGSSQ